VRVGVVIRQVPDCIALHWIGEIRTAEQWYQVNVRGAMPSNRKMCLLYGIPVRLQYEVAGLGGVSDQNDSQIDDSAVADDLVQALQRRQAAQVRVAAVVDACGGSASFQHVVAKGQANRVEVLQLHAVQDVLVAAERQTSDDVTGGLESHPSDAGDSGRHAILIHDLDSLGGEVVEGACSGWSARLRHLKRGRRSCSCGVYRRASNRLRCRSRRW